MSSTLKDSGSFPDMPATTAMKIAKDSRMMLRLVEGRPDFERLALLLDRARSEALRVMHLHGLASPLVVGNPGEPSELEALDRDR